MSTTTHNPELQYRPIQILPIYVPLHVQWSIGMYREEQKEKIIKDDEETITFLEE